MSADIKRLSESLRKTVPEAFEDLLASIGRRSHARPGAGDVSTILARPQDYVAGLMEFQGDAVRGDVVVLSSFAFFAASKPTRAPSPSLSPNSARDWIRVRDWTMELSNQFLGRIKSQFCKFGVAVETSLPKSVSGHPLLVTVRARKSPHLLYVTPGHEVFVWFELVVNEAALTSETIETLSEGDALCF